MVLGQALEQAQRQALVLEQVLGQALVLGRAFERRECPTLLTMAWWFAIHLGPIVAIATVHEPRSATVLATVATLTVTIPRL